MFDVADLAGFPGEFSQEAVDAAVAEIRGVAGWHIPPVVTETLTVFSAGGRVLFLPSMRVISVASVTSAGVTLTDWQLGNGGTLYARWGWPVGPLVVTLTHGYETAPDLIPAVASRVDGFTRDRSVTSQSDGPFTTTYSTDGSTGDPADAAVDRYRIPVVG